MMFVSAETKQEKREDAFHADINIKRDDHHEKHKQYQHKCQDKVMTECRLSRDSQVLSGMTDGQAQE